jgi:hypothetical protein
VADRSDATTGQKLWLESRCTVWRPSFSSLSWFTYASGVIKWNGVFNPMKLAIRPMKDVQLNVSTFHTG